jgi:hypothetical protein
MARMIDLFRQSAVPSNIMRSAAKGALALPPAEMIEILVYLAGNPVFAEQSKLTLAGWDQASALAAASDPTTPPAVLDYFSKPENLRPRLLPALLENASVPESRLVEIAHHASSEIITFMMESTRVQACSAVLHALLQNQHLDSGQAGRVREALAQLGEHTVPVQGEDEEPYEVRHAAEIAAEEGQPLKLVTASGDILGLGFENADEPPASDAVVELEVLPALQAHAAEAINDPNLHRRISTFHKIAKLGVAQRVQLAMKGGREDRFILVRDASKVVAAAVLESPKLTESEVEVFASLRNVHEVVPRTIASKRKFMKRYGVVKALASNPRTPMEISLTLLGHLMVNDLKVLGSNRSVGENIRKLALKLYNQKKAVTGSR